MIDDLPIREELKGSSPYGAPQLQVPYQLNTNENPHPPSTELVEAITAATREVAGTLHRYPDRDAVTLRTALAQYVNGFSGLSLTEKNVWAANGSNEILHQLFSLFAGPGRSALGCGPSYSMHPIIASSTMTQWLNVPRLPDFTIDMPSTLAHIAEHSPHIVIITSPNNPTGGSIAPTDIEQIVQASPGIVIVDEAYAEFSDLPSAVELIATYPHKLVVSRTMSKAFAFAGGRLGYFVASSDIVDAVQLVRLPYHLSVLTQAAATAALGFAQETLASVQLLARERDRVAARLHAMGFTVVDSDANFILFGGLTDSPAAWQRYLDDGILIRDVGIPGFLRVTIGVEQENTAFLHTSERVATEFLA